MFRTLSQLFVSFFRTLRGFADVHPAVYTFNPQRDRARPPHEPIF